MVLLLQLLFSLAVTVIYAVISHISLSVLNVLLLIGLFLASFLAFVIILLLFSVFFIYSTENLDKKKMYKHVILNNIGIYIFNFLYRVKIVVSGEENLPKNNRFVIYANHSEYTDPIYVKQVFKKYPVAFVAKKTLFDNFLIKNLLNGAGCIPISQTIDRSSIQSILDTIESIKNGQPMGVFPEGTRTYSNELIDFKPGTFKIAVKSQANIVPVCLYNMHGILENKTLKRHVAYIHILPVIEYDKYKDLNTITISEMVKTQINNQLDIFKKNIPQSKKN
jgi:1-acyl-sn-glycerol-3-phosphate acyltransferase